MQRFHAALEEHRDELNSLNVYPVPDGDTGTNMLLTQQAVRDELARRDGGGLPDVASAIARSSLMGARGNSGVILAQALRGLAAVLGGGDEADPRTLAGGLERAAAEAYRAVARPAHGTVLDVLSDAAEAASAAASRDLASVTSAALEESRASLARTREELPELRRAGMVDAGAKGIVLLFDALHAAVTRSDRTELVGPFGPVGAAEVDRGEPLPGMEFKFEVQYLLDAEDAAVPSLRRGLTVIGDSVVVVGGDGTYKVHVHTNDPARAVELADGVGTTGSVSVADLEGDVERCLAGRARSVGPADEQATGLVAVADGDGLARILSSLGAAVVRGGPGRNPSVADLLRAIEASPADAVVVLPDHRNVLSAAVRAAEESVKGVRVIEALSVPQGVAAATAFNPAEKLDDNAEAMAEAAEACSWGEVAVAIRDTDTPAGPVRTGDALGLVAGDVVTVGRAAGSVAEDGVDRLRRARHEIITVYWGDGVSQDDADDLESRLRTAHPDLEVELHRGDQPGYPYLIGLE